MRIKKTYKSSNGPEFLHEKKLIQDNLKRKIPRKSSESIFILLSSLH